MERKTAEPPARVSTSLTVFQRMMPKTYDAVLRRIRYYLLPSTSYKKIEQTRPAPLVPHVLTRPYFPDSVPRDLYTVSGYAEGVLCLCGAQTKGGWLKLLLHWCMQVMLGLTPPLIESLAQGRKYLLYLHVPRHPWFENSSYGDG